MDEKSLKYLKALKERGYSKEDAFAALDAQLSKNVTATVEQDAGTQTDGSFSSKVLEGSKAGIEKTAELYKSGNIGGVKAAIGTAGSVASSALGEVAKKGQEGMVEAIPYATPGAGKFTVNPEDSMLTNVAKTIGNIPGGVYNLAAGAANLGLTAVGEAVGLKESGSTGGAILGGLAGLGKSAIDKAGDIAVAGEEKGFVAGATKALDIATKTLAENPVESLTIAKPQIAGELGKTAIKATKAIPQAGKFVVGQGKKVVEGAAGKVTGASSESLRAVAGNPELAQRIMKEGGDSPAAQETYKVIDEFKNGVEKDLSEKGQLGQLYEPIRSVPVRIDQSVVEASIKKALKGHGVEIEPATVSSKGGLNVTASDIGRQGKTLIESALQDVRDKLFKDGRLKEDLTGMDLHNARKVLDKDYLNWDATTPAGSAENAVKGLRKAIDDLAKDNIPGLKELDAKFSEAATKIDEVAREFFTKKPGGGFELKQDIVSRIKNADSPMRLSDRMDILERYVPDARQRLYVSNALRQIEQAEAKFGSAHRSIPQAIGASAGAAIAGPVGAAVGFLAGSVVTPTFMAELAIKAGYAARKLGIKLKSGNEVLAASEKISRKLAKAEKLTAEEAADAAELLRAQSKVQVREKLAEEAKQENLYRTHPAYQESPLHPDFVSNQLKKAEKLKQEAEAYKKQYPVEATQVAKEVETPVLAQAKGQETNLQSAKESGSVVESKNMQSKPVDLVEDVKKTVNSELPDGVVKMKMNIGGKEVEMYGAPQVNRSTGETGKLHDLFKTPEEAAEQVKTNKVWQEEARSRSDRIEAKKKSEEAVNAEKNDIDGFGSELTPIARGRAAAALDKTHMIRTADGGVKSVKVKDFVRDTVENGGEIKEYQVPVVKDVSASRYNKMTMEQQRMHEKEMAKGETKTEYSVGGYNLGKTAYDYAKYLKSKK